MPSVVVMECLNLFYLRETRDDLLTVYNFLCFGGHEECSFFLFLRICKLLYFSWELHSVSLWLCSSLVLFSFFSHFFSCHDSFLLLLWIRTQTVLNLAISVLHMSVPLLVGHSPPQMHLFWPIRISGSFWVFGNRIVVDSSTIWKKITKKQVLFCRKCRDFGAGWTLLSESLWLLFQVVSMCDKLMRDKLTNTKNEFWWLLWILGLVPGKPLNLKQRAAGTQMHEQLKLPQLYLFVYYLIVGCSVSFGKPAPLMCFTSTSPSLGWGKQGKRWVLSFFFLNGCFWKTNLIFYFVFYKSSYLFCMRLVSVNFSFFLI